MTAVTSNVGSSHGAPGSSVVALATAVVKSWKAPIALGIFAVIAVILFALVTRTGTGISTFRLSTSQDFFPLPELQVPTRATGVVVSILLILIAATAAILVRQSRRVPIWVIVIYAILFMFGFLAWAASGGTVPIPGLLIGTVGLATPLIFGALSGVISERVGVVNIAIEGQLLAGAFVAAIVSSITRQPVVGLLAAMVAGMLVSFVLAAFRSSTSSTRSSSEWS